MSLTAIFWAVYVVGYFVCFFRVRKRIDPDEIERIPSLAVLTLLWPIHMAVYVLWRIFRALGVRA